MSDLIDKKEENGLVAEASATPLSFAPARDTKFANTAFNWLNYCGLGFIANSSLSLYIAYNVLTTKVAKDGIVAIGKVITPVASGFDKLKNLVGLGKKLDEATRIAHISASARSAAEILCMFIAGTLILLPMKWMEDHKKSIVDWIDRWKNPEYHKHCQKNGTEPEPLPHESEDEKQTWGKLLSARVAGMAAVLGLDAMVQSFNNKRHAVGKGNFDTAEWRLGGFVYDKLPKSISEKFINFFSRHGADLSGVQAQVLPALEKTVGSDEKRMVFAEQARLFSKEVFFTMVMAGIIYALSKTGISSAVMESLGLKKAKEQHKAIDNMLPDIPLVSVTHGDVDLGRLDREDSQPQAETPKEARSRRLAPEQFRRGEEVSSAHHAGGYADKYMNGSPAQEALSM